MEKKGNHQPTWLIYISLLKPHLGEFLTIQTVTWAPILGVSRPGRLIAIAEGSVYWDLDPLHDIGGRRVCGRPMQRRHWEPLQRDSL